MVGRDGSLMLLAGRHAGMKLLDATMGVEHPTFLSFAEEESLQQQKPSSRSVSHQGEDDQT
jgi:hypothetical protein